MQKQFGLRVNGVNIIPLGMKPDEKPSLASRNDTKSAAKRLTTERRDFIRKRLGDVGEVSFREVREKFGDAPGLRASISGDIKALTKLGMDLESSRGVITNIKHRSITDVYRDENIHPTEKESIARATVGLLCGLNEQRGNLKGFHLVREFEQWAKLLPAKSPEKTVLWPKLQKLWETDRRTIAFDACTTNNAIARLLKPIDLPMKSLTQLDAWTNSRTIFWTLGDPKCRIKTFIIGGGQQHNIGAVVGGLALDCLEIWNPRFSVAIVGTNVVDISYKQLGAYDDADARMKRELLGRAAFRIVVADKSKFRTDNHRGDCPFLPISKKHVDLIITDKIDPDYRTLLQQDKDDVVSILSASDLNGA